MCETAFAYISSLTLMGGGGPAQLFCLKTDEKEQMIETVFQIFYPVRRTVKAVSDRVHLTVFPL